MSDDPHVKPEREPNALLIARKLASAIPSPEVTPIHLALALLWDDTEISKYYPQVTTSPEKSTILWDLIAKQSVAPAKVSAALTKLLTEPPSQNPHSKVEALKRMARMGKSSHPVSNGNGRESTDPTRNKDLDEVLKVSEMLRSQSEYSSITPGQMLLALTQNETNKVTMVMTSIGLDIKNFHQDINSSRSNTRPRNISTLENLNKYAVNLTALAKENKLDPVIGREEEIRRVICILCRRTKNNPVLLGEPGVGKTAVAEALAQRIADSDAYVTDDMVGKGVPDSLRGQVFGLNMGALMAGTSGRGEYEERIQLLLKEVEYSEDHGEKIILFIDELHLIMAGKQSGGGSGMDAANLFKPLLARGKLRCIGATTLAEYRECIEKDGALDRRFAQVIVNEPTIPETITVLRGLRERYEAHHGVDIKDLALVTCAKLASRYLTSRRLPDSAIDLMDEACAAIKVRRETVPEGLDRQTRKVASLEIDLNGLERDKRDPASDKAYRETKNELSDAKTIHKEQEQEYLASQGRRAQLVKTRKDIINTKSDLDIAEKQGNRSEASKLKRKLESLDHNLKIHSDSSSMDTVEPEIIADIVHRWTGIPAAKLLASEKEKLLDMGTILNKSVVGQCEAVEAVTRAIQISGTDLGNPSRPIASFLFVGPTGTGKTQLTKALASFMFNSPDAMIRIDASEFSEKFTLSRLIGSPPGYVGHDQGGQLTEYVRRKPYCLILVDEVEKACREFHNLFLQILDDGRLTDGHGRTVTFVNCVIIMTSNVGSAKLTSGRGKEKEGEAINAVMEELKRIFPPEFLNRLDEVIVFNTLSKEAMAEIVDIRLRELQELLEAKSFKLDICPESKRYLCKAGLSQEYGARHLNRVIKKEILHPLSELHLMDRIREGDPVRVRVKDKISGMGHSSRSPGCLCIVPNHDGRNGQTVIRNSCYDGTNDVDFGLLCRE